MFHHLRKRNSHLYFPGKRVHKKELYLNILVELHYLICSIKLELESILYTNFIVGEF